MSFFSRHYPFAKRDWDANLHPRGKTTPTSRGGSFRPLNEEESRALDAAKRVGYRKLYGGQISDPVSLRQSMQEYTREWLGPGYEDMVARLALRVWDAYSKEPSVYHETLEWMKAAADELAKREWIEEDHPRGKTTDASTPGSFAPKEGGRLVNAAGTAWPESEFSGHVGVRRYKQADTGAMDAEVQASDTPAQTLKAQWGPFPTEAEVLAQLRERVGEKDWERYIADATRMEEQLKATGISQEHYLDHWVTDPVTGKRIPIYDEDRVRDVHAPVLQKYLDRYDQLADQLGDEQAELVVLGGRGGSGKSAFSVDPETGKPTAWNFGYYDQSYLAIDPDEIKKDLARASAATGRYALDAQWNPAGDGSSYWHEESSDVTKMLLYKLRERATAGRRANVVMDLTLASNKLDVVQDFKRAGYSTTLANINIPVQESSYNALVRYLRGNGGRGGRLVPLTVIANSKSNEINFDSMINARDEQGNAWVDHWDLFTAGPSQHRVVASGGSPRLKDLI